MPAPYHDIDEKVEDAFAAYLEQNLTGAAADLPIKVAFDFSAVEPDFISVSVPNCVEDPPDTGCYVVTAHVAIVSTKDTSRTVHRAYVAAVFDLLFESGIVGYLNASGITDFTVQQVTKGVRIRQVEGSTRYTIQTIELLCHPS